MVTVMSTDPELLWRAQTRRKTCVERRHLGNNQTRIRFGGTPVCVQEVSQLVTEEVSIFRQTEPAERLSSRLGVTSLLRMFCSRGADYWFLLLYCAIAWLLLMTFLSFELCIHVIIFLFFRKRGKSLEMR